LISELRDAYIFAQLDDDQLQRVQRMCRRVALNDGETLFEMGDEAKRFFLVQSGHMKLYRLSVSGNEKVIEVVSPGHTFAEALMFGERPRYPVTAGAIGATQLIAVESRPFLDLLSESTATCFRMMTDMSVRLRRMIKEIDDLTLQSARSRVAGYLWGMSTVQGGTRDEVELEMPKGVLASRLSIKPETFSRILHAFTEEGLVRVEGGRIRILNAVGLQACAEPTGFCGQSFGPGNSCT
jgi:CRP-like cAMP-binding protein